MPVYEFYCEKCNTVFSFFSRGVNTTKIPNCPQCRKALRRQMSLFAKVSRGTEAPAEDGMPPLDEAKMEKAMAMLAGEAEKINEDDPRQAAQLMRKLTDATRSFTGRRNGGSAPPSGKRGRSRPDRGGDGRPSGRGRSVHYRGKEKGRGAGI